MTSADSAAEFALVPEHVRDAGQFVQQTAHALISGVRSADTEVQSLMATWKGSAADSYLTGWEEARQAAVDVLEALETMAELLGVVIESFEGVESGNTAALASPPTMSILDM